MTGNDSKLILVFTDLDGSLLDHHDYSYRDALPLLRQLESRAIPVIPISSKTRAEIESLREALGNTHPFVVENGAAVFIPRGYFPEQPEATVCRDDYWVREFSPGRAHWLELLESLREEFSGEYDYFYRAGTEGIARMTGLPPERAAEANLREYSEPVQWLGEPERRRLFIAALAHSGATVLQGGRFLSVAGATDKGRALQWLRSIYRQYRPGQPCHDLAVGDSPNDCAMLEAAETALLIRSSAHDFPRLQRREGVIHSKWVGPAGWAEGVTRWLDDLDT